MQAVGVQIGRFVQLIGEGDPQRLTRLQAKGRSGHLPLKL